MDLVERILDAITRACIHFVVGLTGGFVVALFVRTILRELMPTQQGLRAGIVLASLFIGYVVTHMAFLWWKQSRG